MSRDQCLIEKRLDRGRLSALNDAASMKLLLLFFGPRVGRGCWPWNREKLIFKHFKADYREGLINLLSKIRLDTWPRWRRYMYWLSLLWLFLVDTPLMFGFSLWTYPLDREHLSNVNTLWQGMKTQKDRMCLCSKRTARLHVTPMFLTFIHSFCSWM